MNIWPQILKKCGWLITVVVILLYVVVTNDRVSLLKQIRRFEDRTKWLYGKVMRNSNHS